MATAQPFINVTAPMSQEMVEALEKIAYYERVSRAEIVRQAVENFLKQVESQYPPKDNHNEQG